ncbi:MULTISPECIES: chain length determinant protein EpsF [Methylocaldum]|jgi:chain length determinant protein EpsF|uniref:chain length determinant protein EpsF n=1 Tax=unclassified Methylocaldum TaxID=2622260 RepID=UPI00098A4ED2|nr:MULTISPECIES: chain length determinant protein EpsF [unclassified Methylocaldum]MBP1149891.1 chain length determinant protein EpsF [Methylocaldum sp. RMAD-M]MDV3240830.1 chain length determinant protein EpsF [Methylocaldum sp.]
MNLNQFLQILWARLWVLVLTPLAAALTVLAISLILPKAYTATSTLVVDYKGVDPITGIAVPAQLMPGYMATQVNIIGSHNVALKVVDRLKLADLPESKERFEQEAKGTGDIRDWLADQLLKKLEVQPSRESSVIQVSYSDVDPTLAAALSNAFAENYIATNLELKTEPARQNAAWFEQQIKGLRENLEKAQASLSEYQQEKGIVALDQHWDVENSRLEELSKQLVAAQSHTYDLISRRNQLEAAGSAFLPETLPDVLANSVVQDLKAKLALAETRLAEIGEKYDINHPIHQQAVAEAGSLKRKLAAETKTILHSLNTAVDIARMRENELRTALGAQKARVLELNKQRDELAVLTHEVEHARQSYTAALQRFNQTRLESEANQTNVAVLNPAKPPLRPSRPKVLLNVAVAAFLGVILAVSFALLLELLDRRVRSPEDLSITLGLPVLGVLTDAKLRHPKWRLAFSKTPV